MIAALFTYVIILVQFEQADSSTVTPEQVDNLTNRTQQVYDILSNLTQSASDKIGGIPDYTNFTSSETLPGYNLTQNLIDAFPALSTISLEIESIKNMIANIYNVSQRN